MPTFTLDEAKARPGDLIEHLQPGEEVLIMDQGRPLAQLKKATRNSWPCKAGVPPARFTSHPISTSRWRTSRSTRTIS